MNGACNSNLFAPAPWGPGEKSKVKYLIQLQSQFQRFFIPNVVYVLTNERYKSYQTGFSVAWVMPLGWDFEALGVPRWSIF